MATVIKMHVYFLFTFTIFRLKKTILQSSDPPLRLETYRNGFLGWIVLPQLGFNFHFAIFISATHQLGE